VTENRLIVPKSVVKSRDLCYNKNSRRRGKESCDAAQKKAKREKEIFLRFIKRKKEIYFE
jgi:hypothetical protein